MACATLQIPLLQRSCDERSVEEQNFTDSELEEPSDDEETCVGGKCRRAGKRYRAPKPYSNLPWLEREDCCLRSVVAAKAPDAGGKRRWKEISKEKNSLMRPRRSSKQCRDRWTDHLKPLLNKGPWTRAEFESLVAKHKEQTAAGTVAWACMAKEMGTNRSGNDLKNKFNAMERRVQGMEQRNKSFSADELEGPAAALIAYITELNAAERAGGSPSQQLLRRRRQPHTASEDSDSGCNSEEFTPTPPPRALRPRRQQWRAVAEPAVQADQLDKDETPSLIEDLYRQLAELGYPDTNVDANTTTFNYSMSELELLEFCPDDWLLCDF